MDHKQAVNCLRPSFYLSHTITQILHRQWLLQATREQGGHPLVHGSTWCTANGFSGSLSKDGEPVPTFTFNYEALPPQMCCLQVTNSWFSAGQSLKRRKPQSHTPFTMGVWVRSLFHNTLVSGDAVLSKHYFHCVEMVSHMAFLLWVECRCAVLVCNLPTTKNWYMATSLDKVYPLTIHYNNIWPKCDWNWLRHIPPHNTSLIRWNLTRKQRHSA